MRKYILEITVFLIGALTMVFEILGFLIIAPYFGTALSVSSNLIGLILFGLALGYFLGGKIADLRPQYYFFSYIILFAAFYLGAVFLLQDFINSYIKYQITGLLWSSFAAIFIIFVPINILFGMVLPYAVKLKVSDISRSGRETGFLYSLSVVGSVVGTFLAGFILIPYTSIPVVVLVTSTLLLIFSVLIFPKNKFYLAIIPVFLTLFLYSDRLEYKGVYTANKFSIDGSVIIDRIKLKKIDDASSQYSRIQIFDGLDEATQRPIRLMRINKELHSGTFLDGNELLFKYAKFNRLGGHFNPNAKKALLIGGGGYSYANYFLGDTPFFDAEKVWSFNEKFYGNNKKLSLPILISLDDEKLLRKPLLIYQSKEDKKKETKGSENLIEATNQKPGNRVVVDMAKIGETGFFSKGFVHVHELSRNGLPGAVISPNYFINKQGKIIGHSRLISGENNNIVVELGRPSKDGEVLYPMLHRDNGNGKFDPIVVDGYESMEFLDVVEIDSKTTEFAEKYFHLNKADPRLRIFHEDGRTFINRTKDKYDIVYVDAFRSFYSVPFQLMTIEAARKLYSILNEKGVVVFNIPSALGGEMGRSFQAAYKTFKEVFPATRVYAVSDPGNEEIVQNIVFIGFQSKDGIRESLNDDPEINEELERLWKEKLEKDVPILTDEFAPADYFINKLINIPTM